MREGWQASELGGIVDKNLLNEPPNPKRNLSLFDGGCKERLRGGRVEVQSMRGVFGHTRQRRTTATQYGQIDRTLVLVVGVRRR